MKKRSIEFVEREHQIAPIFSFSPPTYTDFSNKGGSPPHHKNSRKDKVMKALLQKIITSNAGYGALALRIPVGLIFMAHGFLAGLAVMGLRVQVNGWHQLA